MEVWKDVVGYEGIYEVSNFGRVKSLERYEPCRNGHLCFRKEKILKGQISQYGYRRFQLRKNGKVFSTSSHRLVANSFICNTDNKPFVNHIDGDRLNNTVDNLEWVTHSENMKHAVEIGLHKPDVSKARLLAVKSNMVKINQFDLKGNLIGSYNSIVEAAETLGLNKTAIANNVRGTTKTSFGFVWKRKG